MAVGRGKRGTKVQRAGIRVASTLQAGVILRVRNVPTAILHPHPPLILRHLRADFSQSDGETSVGDAQAARPSVRDLFGALLDTQAAFGTRRFHFQCAICSVSQEPPGSRLDRHRHTPTTDNVLSVPSRRGSWVPFFFFFFFKKKFRFTRVGAQPGFRGS